MMSIYFLIVVILTIKYYSIFKKEQLTDTFHNLEESRRYYTEWKKMDTKKCTLSFYIWSFRDGKTYLRVNKKVSSGGRDREGNAN